MATIRQKKAFKAVGENGGIISKAMQTAGYAPSQWHATEKLTESDGWKELTKEFLPDKDLAKQHRKFLYSGKEEIGVKALDLAYKVKGNYAPEKSVQVQVKTILPDDKYYELKNKFIKELDAIENE